MRTTYYRSEKHGNVLINESKSGVDIWLDPEECAEGFFLEERHEDNEWWFDTWFDDVDFSDVPKDGKFKSFDDAKAYIESKLGTLIDEE